MLEQILMSIEIPTVLLILIAILLVGTFAGAIFGLLLLMRFRYLALNEHYNIATDKLSEELKNKIISPEMRQWMQRDLEEVFQRGWNKD